MKQIFIIIFLFLTINLSAQIKAFWATIWDIPSEKAILQVVNKAKENNFNQIIAEVRYRGDALYFPNRNLNKYNNLDVRSYVVENDYFDPLQFLIETAKQEGIEVIAWMTCFVITPHDLSKIAYNHIFYQHPEWITTDQFGTKMPTNSHEGAFLDPGLPQVQDYLINVIGDIATNYNVDGIHLDYVRYPSQEYGKHPQSLQIFENQTEFAEDDSWQKWREEQINRFVKRAYHEVKSIDINIELSAAVFPKLTQSNVSFSQNWYKWLEGSYIDKVYLMAYTPDNLYFKNIIQSSDVLSFNDRIVIGLRGWCDNCDYSYSKIEEKIKLVNNRKFAGVSFFSYSGLASKNYFEKLKSIQLPTNKRSQIINNSIFGYLRKDEIEPYANVKISLNGEISQTDENGFFSFDNLEKGEYSLQASIQNELLSERKIKFEKGYKRLEINNLEEYAKQLALFYKKSKNGIAIYWNNIFSEYLKIYRREVDSKNKPFKLIDIVKTKQRTFVDTTADLFHFYEYNVTNFTETIQKKILVDNISNEIIFEVLQNQQNVKFMIKLEKSARLNWRMISDNGEIIFKKQSWYSAGQTIENWNGITERGSKIQNGNYTIYCFSDTFMREYKKDFEINNITDFEEGRKYEN
ncbi:MAG: family 10 glycosylhydrolase [Candidatus Cloacimonadota bacterium]|nr:family 10 glycosylhydrolase [Candidatus Cloacimonadota bacterium]